MVTTVAKPIMALTAADLMSRTIVMIPEAMSMQGAAHLLSQNNVSGGPVVDHEGRCMGVISATDFLLVADRGTRPGANCFCRQPEGMTSPWQIVDEGGVPDDAVRYYMTRDPVMVSPSANIGELAEMMLNAHIHRIVVVDPERHPLGVVSSTDILAAVAHVFRGQPFEVNRPAAGNPSEVPAVC